MRDCWPKCGLELDLKKSVPRTLDKKPSTGSLAGFGVPARAKHIPLLAGGIETSIASCFHRVIPMH